MLSFCHSYVAVVIIIVSGDLHARVVLNIDSGYVTTCNHRQMSGSPYVYVQIYF